MENDDIDYQEISKIIGDFEKYSSIAKVGFDVLETSLFPPTPGTQKWYLGLWLNFNGKDFQRRNFKTLDVTFLLIRTQEF